MENGSTAKFWTFSSVGQSNRLITDRSRVRVPAGALERTRYVLVAFMSVFSAGYKR